MFGLSQLLFVGSTTLFTKTEESQINNLIYKFIWTKNLDMNKAPDRIKRSTLNCKIEDLGFGMIDFREVITSIRIKTLLRLLNNSNHPLNGIIKSSLNNSVINITCNRNITPAIDNTISIIKKLWKQVFKSLSDIDFNICYLMQNEYIGNLIYPRFRNKKLGLKHRHNKLGEILNDNLDHPILKKIYNWLHPNNLKLVRSVVDMSNPQVDYKYLPIRGKLTYASKLSSKQIRTALTNNSKPIPKIIVNPTSEKMSHLGRLLKRLTNVKLKGKKMVMSNAPT